MKSYMHNEKSVIYQMTEKSFLDSLNSNGITPIELPELDPAYRIFRYTKDNSEKYACVKNFGEYEAIYLTESYPEDGFKALMEDIEGQIKGEKPTKLQTRFELALIKAQETADRYIKEKYPEKYLAWGLVYPPDVQKEWESMVKLGLHYYGYDSKNITRIDIPGIDFEYIQKILAG